MSDPEPPSPAVEQRRSTRKRCAAREDMAEQRPSSAAEQRRSTRKQCAAREDKAEQRRSTRKRCAARENKAEQRRSTRKPCAAKEDKAKQRRSTRKRCAAREDKAGTAIDLDRDAFGGMRDAEGCLTLEGPGERGRSAGIQNPRCSKRQRRAEDGMEDPVAKVGGKSSGCGCSRKRHLPDEAFHRFPKRRKEVKPSEITGSLDIAAIMDKSSPDVTPLPQDKSALAAHADGGSGDFEFMPHINPPSQLPPSAMSSSKKREHPVQNQSPHLSSSYQSTRVIEPVPASVSYDDINAGGRRPYLGDDATEEEDLSRRSQIFVNVGGSHVSLQKDLTRTSVKMLVESACKTAGRNVNDFYCTLSGKCLDEENMLSCYPIERNTTIRVQQRLRAGFRFQTVKCSNWDEVVAGIYRFHLVSLTTSLVDRRTNRATARFLSERIQGFSREVLIALCKIHMRGYSLDGNFQSIHILFHKGTVIFDDAIVEVRFTDARGRRDYTRAEAIFRPVFFDEGIKRFPLHAEHLLNFLSACPTAANLRSEKLITFVTNHPALQTYMERISSCDNLDGMAERLYGAALTRFCKIIGRIDWKPIKNVSAMNTVFTHGATWHEATQELLSTYFNDCRGCTRFAKNFFKHGPTNIHMEILEAAFSLAMSRQNFLPNMLEGIAIIDPPLPAAFHAVKVLGKKVLMTYSETQNESVDDLHGGTGQVSV